MNSMDWQDIPEVTDDWVLKSAAPAQDIRRLAADAFTAVDVGYYFNPILIKTALYLEQDAPEDRELCRAAVKLATGDEPLFLSYQDLTDPDCTWVKVAYSPTLRRAGELLNFFPGQYPGGIPNSPSPIAAMLTSGLLGAGVGYGGGKLLSSMLPEKYGRKLGRTGAMLGAALGAVPGAMWGGTNVLDDRNFNDSSLLNHAPTDELSDYPNAMNGVSPAQQLHVPEALHGLEQMKTGAAYQAATDAYFEKNADTFARPYTPAQPTLMDVNIDALGRTLWDTQASPALAATTMGSMYAAQQLPDPHGRPGWATGHQLGQLAQNAAGDYMKGMLVGAALNQVIGTPYSASTFGVGNVALGVIGAVVPKLFGR